jgi:hypothetical protein
MIIEPYVTERRRSVCNEDTELLKKEFCKARTYSVIPLAICILWEGSIVSAWQFTHISLYGTIIVLTLDPL